jgi:hypothetical protein
MLTIKNFLLMLVLTLPRIALHAQNFNSPGVPENQNPDGSFFIANGRADKEKKSYLYLQLKVDNGGFLPTSSDSAAQELVKSSYYLGIDVRLGWQKRDPDILAQLHRYPKAGIGFFASTFNNSNIGNPNALYGFVDIPFHKPGGKWTWLYGGAFGISYNFNPYDPETNPVNVFLGSERNVYINLYLEGHYAVSKRIEIGAGLGFKHFSNGSYKLPNAGINMIPLTIMAQYRFSKEVPLFEPKVIPPHESKNFLTFFWANGSKQYSKGENNFYKTTLSAQYLHEFSYKYRIGVGFDVFYSQGGINRVTSDKSDFNKNFSYAPTICWEWLITKHLVMPLAIGVYLNRNEQNDETEKIYERVGIRYRFDNDLFAGVSLKAHYGKADFVEYTIGYSLQLKKK